MSLPPRALYTLTEVAARWSCSIADIVEWAFSGHLEIVVAIPPTRFGGLLFPDMVAVAPSDVLRMCPRFGAKRSAMAAVTHRICTTGTA